MLRFLRSLPLRAGYGDTLLLGLDHDNDREEIERAYNDSGGVINRWIMNGLKAAGAALGDSELFDLSNWEYTNSYDEGSRVHEAFYKCLHPHRITIPGAKEEVCFSKDELLKIEISLKYSERDAYTLFTDANLRPIQRWMDSTSRYSVWLLERPPFSFPLLSSPTTASEEIIGKKFGVPSMLDWQDMWNAWDFVTLRMIPSSVHFEKSAVDLPHVCLFHLGHIPTFLDIHLSRLLQEPHTHPEEFKVGFCIAVYGVARIHPCNVVHSGVSWNDEEEDWPSLSSILSFRERVRERLTKLYMNVSSGAIQLTRKLLDELGVERSLLRISLPPPWESLLASWNAAPKPSSRTVVIEATTVTLGIDDIEADDADRHVFGWDSESSSRRVSVDAFRISWRPITNGEFFDYYTGIGRDEADFPASWVGHEDGDIRVRTLYGSVSMSVARDWPVLTSYDNLSMYASVHGGRLPAEPELWAFMDKFACGYEGGANIGFRNWHPVPATTGVETLGGQGHNGGVWEWTSTVFDTSAGFFPSEVYPGYSADVFDNDHQVVLGGSFATIPRIAESGACTGTNATFRTLGCIGTTGTVVAFSHLSRVPVCLCIHSPLQRNHDFEPRDTPVEPLWGDGASNSHTVIAVVCLYGL
ncbi:histidine-specific methyltransferase [Lanmaoa asiatica]|nr:histidine-specific methyltransferase [Lanmaoa asiatica]